MTTSATNTSDAPTKPRRFFWERYAENSPPSGADLAALRRGTNRAAGEVPGMWAYYRMLSPQGDLTDLLRAEHVALTLFAVHQQSLPRLVHRKGVGLGTAMLLLKRSDKFSAEALDRRFAAAATATSLTELALHLRGLVTQLRSLPGQPLDYTRLLWQLRDWQTPAEVGHVRRRWGGEYFAPAKQQTPETDTPDLDS